MVRGPGYALMVYLDHAGYALIFELREGSRAVDFLIDLITWGLASREMGVELSCDSPPPIASAVSNAALTGMGD